MQPAYKNELLSMDDPSNPDSNIDLAMIHKLLSMNKRDALGTILDALVEEDSTAELFVSDLMDYMDGREAVKGDALANRIADNLECYLRDGVSSDYNHCIAEREQQMKYEYDAAEDYAYEAHKDKLRGL